MNANEQDLICRGTRFMLVFIFYNLIEIFKFPQGGNGEKG